MIEESVTASFICAAISIFTSTSARLPECRVTACSASGNILYYTCESPAAVPYVSVKASEIGTVIRSFFRGNSIEGGVTVSYDISLSGDLSE